MGVVYKEIGLYGLPRWTLTSLWVLQTYHQHRKPQQIVLINNEYITNNLLVYKINLVTVQLPVLKEGTLKHVEMVLLTKISMQTCSLLSSDIPIIKEVCAFRNHINQLLEKA